MDPTATTADGPAVDEPGASGDDPRTDAVKLIDDARESVRFEAAQRERRERRNRRVAVVASLVLSLLVSLTALAVGLVILERQDREREQRTADLAAALQRPVAEQVLADGRAESARAARDVLRSANSRLVANDLPIVPEPPADALSVVVQMQGNRAQLLADLGSVDFIGEGLRARYGAVDAFPAAFLDTLPTGALVTPPPPAPPGDQVVELLPSDLPEPGAPTLVPLPGPGARSPAAPREPGPQPVPAPRGPASRPVPAPSAPAPAPNRDRGLCLGGFLLCEN